MRDPTSNIQTYNVKNCVTPIVLFSLEETKLTSQSNMVDEKQVTYGEALLHQ